MKIFITIAFQLSVIITNAQSEAIQKIAQQISTKSLKKNLYYLSSDQLEGRLMASHGDTLASIFIADWYRGKNLVAPFNNHKNYFQSITAQKKIFSKEAIILAGKKFSR